MTSLILALAAGAISLFAATLFLTRREEPSLRLPLVLVFLANALTYASTVAELLDLPEAFIDRLEVSEIVPFYLMLPGLWFYVKGLTAEQAVQLRRGHLWHLAFFALALMMALGIWSLAPEAQTRMIEGPLVKTPFELVIGLLMNVVFLAQPLVTVGYAFAITRKLVRYRARLKDLFASTEQRELRWIGWIVLVFAADQMASWISDFLGATRGSGFYTAPVDDFIELTLFWLLALWGARPMPGVEDVSGKQPFEFRLELRLQKEERHGKTNGDQSGQMSEKSASSPKYGRSALDETTLLEIAGKIERAMKEDKLYLDPNFSLSKLSKHIRVQANQVSQTLNAHMEKSFFDYVNGWRIRDAMPRIAEGRETVLAIAYDVGFNSRSSFYKSFKLETGETPTRYREKRQS